MGAVPARTAAIMIPMKRWMFVIGALYGALGIVGGAIGAHVMRQRLSSTGFENFQHAVSYLLVHGPLLIVLAAYCANSKASRGLTWCALGIMIGTALFAGGMVAWEVVNVSWLRPVIPVGGSLLIVSWLGLVVVGIMDTRE